MSINILRSVGVNEQLLEILGKLIIQNVDFNSIIKNQAGVRCTERWDKRCFSS